MSYYSIEDLLTEEYEMSSRVYYAPYIDEKDPSFYQQFQEGQSIKLPMWIANNMQSKGWVTSNVPHFLHVKGLSQILNNISANLSQYNAYFYQLAFKILNYYSQVNQEYRQILVQVIRGLFLKRFRDALLPQADTRDLKSVSMQFLDSLPDYEKSLFKRLESGFIAFHRWRQQRQPKSASVHDLGLKRQRRA